MYSAHVRGQEQWWGVVCEAACVRDGADAGACVDSAGNARDCGDCEDAATAARVLNAASLFYLNLGAVSSPSMQVPYGPGAPQT